MTNRDIELKTSLDEFTEEIIFENPDWVAERRTEFLVGRIIKLLDEIRWWSKYKNIITEDWWKESIEESVISPIEKEILKMIREIKTYDQPHAIDYDSKITDSDIDRAKERSMAEVASETETIRRAGGRFVCKCPFHQEKTGSMILYDNSFCCFGCGVAGDTIDWVQKMHNLSFKEAVKYLIRRY